MKSKLTFSISIQAPVALVYDKMLGITDTTTYESWVALFNPTSTYEGKWEKGEKIYFIGTDENGNKGGMVAIIADIQPNAFVSIKHKGLFQNGQEIMEGPDVEKWANGFENYTFQRDNETTTLIVDLDVTEDFADFMNEIYPKALDKLKEICEG